MRALIIGAGGQGATADDPKGPNKHKVLSFGHALASHLADITWFDLNDAAALAAAKIWGGQAITYGEAVKVPYDLVCVATPDDTHYPILLDILRWFKPLPRLVVCEKPITHNMKEAEDIIRMYKDARIPLLVDYTRRFIPQYQRIQKEVAGGGRAFGYCAFNRGWVHTGSHAIDTFRYLGINDYRIFEMPDGPRHWILAMQYEDSGMTSTWTEERIGQEPVDPMFNFHMRYVIQNACDFLNYGTPLICTGEDAQQTLVETYRRMNMAEREGQNGRHS